MEQETGQGGEVSEVATSDSKPWAFCDPNTDVIESEIIQVDWPQGLLGKGTAVQTL